MHWTGCADSFSVYCWKRAAAPLVPRWIRRTWLVEVEVLPGQIYMLTMSKQSDPDNQRRKKTNPHLFRIDEIWRRKHTIDDKVKQDHLCWFSQEVTAKCHIFGGAHPGTMTPQFELGQNVGTMHLTSKLHRPIFTRSEIIMLTNKRTHPQTNKQKPLKKSNALRYNTTFGNKPPTSCGAQLACKCLYTSIFSVHVFVP